jgi:sugar/nucleoside kinase (ribokinase family)
MEALCIGMATADILVTGAGETVPGRGTTFADSLAVGVGGDAVNQAITLAKLGHQVGLMSLVGQDPLGQYIKDQCQRSGVQVDGVAVSAHHPTWMAVVLIGAGGERSFIAAKDGIVSDFSMDTTALDLIKNDLKVLSIGSLFCSKPLDTEVLPTVLRAAKAVGAITVADLVVDRYPAELDEISEVLGLLDYVCPSQAEAELFTGRSDPDDCADLFLSRGVRNVVIKLGRRGALARTRTQRIWQRAYPVPVADTTGSGDNFMAGFISGQLRGFDLADCLDLAAATAAVSVQAIGATAGVRDYEQVAEFRVAAAAK